MNGDISLDRLSRLARTLRSVDDTDAAMLGKLIEIFLHNFQDAAPPTMIAAEPSTQPKLFAQADTHPVLTAVTLRLRSRFGDDLCGAWIAKLTFVGESKGVVLLSAPNKFVADHVHAQFGDALLRAWQAEQSGVVRVEVAAGGRFLTRDSEQPRSCLSAGQTSHVSA